MNCVERATRLIQDCIFDSELMKIDNVDHIMIHTIYDGYLYFPLHNINIEKKDNRFYINSEFKNRRYNLVLESRDYDTPFEFNRFKLTITCGEDIDEFNEIC